MKIAEILEHLEELAPPGWQESYDNSGLIAGDRSWECTGVLCSLDALEQVVEEAIEKKCNLVISHHPILFRGLKSLTGKNYVEKTLIRAIRHQIALYAIHTNLDNVSHGVNSRLADRLGLVNRNLLLPREGSLRKLVAFVPVDHIEKLRSALFDAGGGHIGNYSECGFTAEGTGTFRGGDGTQPFVGIPGQRHYEPELRFEMVFPSVLQQKMLETLKASHPYEEVAYDVLELANPHPGIGAGAFGELEQPLDAEAFLAFLKERCQLKVIRHTWPLQRPVHRVAVCGGAGSFLISRALSCGADALVTADCKYHEFFDAENRMMICDIGHYESERFTVDLLVETLQQKFPNFAVLKSELSTNPVYYYY